MIITLRRVVGWSLGYTMTRVNTNHIQFYQSDTLTQGSKELNVTKIAFNDAYLDVLETPEEIDALIEYLKENENE